MADEKKIIIDEDWKAQVQAEKEAAKQAASGTAQAASSASGGGPASAPDAAMGAGQPAGAATTSQAGPRLPPASFEMLATTLATEALVALGQIPHPLTNKAEVQLNHAQYLIDTLEVLREKTKGNLTDREYKLLDEVLHQLRMVYIDVANEPVAT